MIINGIDFDAKLEELRTNLHAAICYRFNGYVPIAWHIQHCFNTATLNSQPFDYSLPGTIWIDFANRQQDIDREINDIVRKHFWELL